MPAPGKRPPSAITGEGDQEDVRWSAPRRAPARPSTGEEEFEPDPETGADPLPDPEYRRRQPVRVRRSSAAAWKKWWARSWRPLFYTGLAVAVLAGINSFFFHSHWFVLQGSDQIEVEGAVHATPEQLRGVFAGDLGRNIFYIPLAERQREIEAIPWVRTASVLRIWPARLQVRVRERTPIAYGRANARLILLDADGVVLPPPARGQFNFPVLSGLAGLDASDPNSPALLARRRPAMHAYETFRTSLDHDGQDQLRNFSEISLQNLNDIQARVSVPGSPGDTVLIHFGNRNFAARYGLFLSQIANWEQQYPNLVSVDLHYDGEAIVNPGPATTAPAGSGRK